MAISPMISALVSLIVVTAVIIIGLLQAMGMVYNIYMKCLYDYCFHEGNRARGLCVKHWNYEQYGSCVNGCFAPASNKNGWCANCKKRNGPPKRRNKGSAINSDTHRVCSSCKNVFLIEEFIKSYHPHRCVVCQSKQKRKNYLKKIYGIDENQYDLMLEKNNGGCHVCGKTKQENGGKNLSIDHDHLCCPGKKSCGSCVRGLLCDNCNRAMGLLKDNPELASNLVVYMKNNFSINKKLLINLDW
jgi:hypothetical protein